MLKLCDEYTGIHCTTLFTFGGLENFHNEVSKSLSYTMCGENSICDIVYQGAKSYVSILKFFQTNILINQEQNISISTKPFINWGGED